MRFKYIQIVQNNFWKQMQSIGYLYNFYKKESIAWFLLQVSDLLFVFPTNTESASFLQDSNFKIVHIQKSLKIGVKKALCMISFSILLWTFEHQQSIQIWSLVDEMPQQ